VPKEIDEHAATELLLYIENDASLYQGMRNLIVQNLQKKRAKGTYISSRAVDAFMHLATEAAKRYTKEFGGTYFLMFNVPTRRYVATQLEESFRAENA
jgi:galactokinase/mevalonate kinase-like predicted kinase